LKADAICEAQQKTIELAIRLAGSAPAPVRVANIGGGFGIPYFPGDLPLDLAPIGKNLRAIVERANEALPKARLVIELGRYLVGEAGLYVCRVVDRKVSRGEVFLVTDGGLHHRPRGIRTGHHQELSGRHRQQGQRRAPWLATVVGPVHAARYAGGGMDLAEAHPGDLVAVFQSGAYGLTASPQAFSAIHPALEVLV
jgi:diaminopimelate decarboxylase